MKHLILVTSPPACGKTYVSKELAKALKPIVYLDKDTLIVLSKQIFVVANQEINRSSQFFEDNIRNYEYDAIFDVALESLEYCDLALINAPFAREIRDPKAIASMREKLAKVGAKLTVIWVHTDVEVCRQRMIDRNSDRDTWKLEHWDEYIATQNFNQPDIDGLLIFNNSNEEEFNESIARISKELRK